MASKKFEKLVLSIIKDLHCTEQDAIEVAKLEIKAGDINNYITTMASHKPKVKSKILDKQKVEIIKLIQDTLQNAGFDNISISNPQQKIDFYQEDKYYTIMLTKHKQNK